MSDFKVSAATNITDSGIRKHFRKVDPWQPIFEFAWNGFDAKASTVNISYSLNEMGGLEYLSVSDDGLGIDFRKSEDNFGKFNESSKVGSASQHGSHGRGRLSFHVLCNEARWYTRTEKGEDAVVIVNSADLAHYDVQGLSAEKQHANLSSQTNGTCVELLNFVRNLPSEDELARLLSIEFGWYLALNKDKKIVLNTCPISIPEHEISENLARISHEAGRRGR